jgi:hypothetical protein
MGIAALEEKFQNYTRACSDNLPQLKAFAKQISGLQKQFRLMLDDITPILCSQCSTKCCSGMPIDGWFTAEDYFAFRMLYDVPRVSKDSHADWRNCSFLNPEGCSLPKDMRPLACVKVNCAGLNAMLAERGELAAFKRLCAQVDDIQTQLWGIVNAYEGE